MYSRILLDLCRQKHIILHFESHVIARATFILLIKNHGVWVCGCVCVWVCVGVGVWVCVGVGVGVWGCGCGCVGLWVWVNSLSLFFLLFFSFTQSYVSASLYAPKGGDPCQSSWEKQGSTPKKQDARLPRPIGGNTSTFELWSQVKVRRPRRLASLGACHPCGVRAGGHAVVSTS